MISHEKNRNTKAEEGVVGGTFSCFPFNNIDFNMESRFKRLSMVVFSSRCWWSRDAESKSLLATACWNSSANKSFEQQHSSTRTKGNVYLKCEVSCKYLFKFPIALSDDDSLISMLSNRWRGTCRRNRATFRTILFSLLKSNAKSYLLNTGKTRENAERSCSNGNSTLDNKLNAQSRCHRSSKSLLLLFRIKWK